MKNLGMLMAVLISMVGTTQMTAQEFGGLDVSPADIASYPGNGRVSEKKVKVIYSRPQLKGRALADLAPAGKVWRTGANEATEIIFYEDAKFGDQNVEAGSYSLFTIPGEGEWTVILNRNLNQWGAYSYDEAADVARITADATNSGESLEAFSIAFQEEDNTVNLVMGWGTTRVAVPIEFTM